MWHSTGALQIGPGKAARFENHARDDGRFRVTGRAEDAFAFRTPSLRNVIETAPYGHAGAHSDLAEFIAAHTNPAGAFAAFDRASLDLPPLASADDFRILDDAAETHAIMAAAQARQTLTDKQIAQIISFLETLSDETSLTGRLGIPASVPSGLPIDR